VVETAASPSLLLVDDDEVFCLVLARALRVRGFCVEVAHDGASALQAARRHSPQYAVVDLKMPGETGLPLIRALHELDPDMHILMLTGYASIQTAVEAIKLGAAHYLAKPATPDEILTALHRKEGSDELDAEPEPLSVNRLEWEHIQRVLAVHQGNISATARALKMHRRTLQRKLSKRPVKN
jgi:two-component system, response regulator RegA